MTTAIEDIWCVVKAVRKNGAVQSTFPVIGTASELTYDLLVTYEDGTVDEIEGCVPVGNRWHRNIRVERAGFGFLGKLVAGEIQAPVPEVPNSVECPA